MPFIDSPFIISRFSDTLWELEEELYYEGNREDFVVPAGYQTDFATVPQILTWLVPKYGTYTLAAVLHDYLVTDMVNDYTLSSHDADGLFRRVLREQGVGFAQRWMMWAGVRWGAAVSRNPRRRRGLVPDLPLVLLISVLSLPIVLPGVAGILVGLLLFGLVRLLTGKLA